MKRKIISGSMLILCGSVMMLAGFCVATNPTSVPISVSVVDGCSVEQLDSGSHAISLAIGTVSSNISGSTFSIFCNDLTGWRLMAIGYGNSTDGDTSMHATVGTGTIATGTGTTGSSSWAMRLIAGTGVTLDNGFESFSDIPSENTRVAYMSSTSIGATVSAKYQIYASADQAMGDYVGAVKYTLATPAAYGDIMTISNMQDMTTAVCERSTVGSTNQLMDARDNKYYWVAKLADGNCWMTQNLDFNINATTVSTLTNEYTDLNSQASWTPSSSYYTRTSISGNTSNTGYYSWDLGDYYWTPTANTGWSSCGNTSGYANCTGRGFSATKPTQDGASNTIEGSQYQVGTLYQWNAATAGSGGTITNTNAQDSICPKGWRLPIANSTTANYSFGKLLTAYSYSGWSSRKNIQNTPLFFVPGGNNDSGTLWNASSEGYYWSSTATSSGGVAYNLAFSSSSINLSASDNRYVGYNVRCVAR